MLNSFVFVVLPYAALALCLVVTPCRYFSNRLTWSAYSTQFLEQKALYWGIVPWHYGLILVLAAHILGFVAAGALKPLLASPGSLLVVESVGLALGLSALFGGLVLLLRRGRVPLLNRVTTFPDWFLLALLTAQAASGVYIAVFLRWGSVWYLHTVVPYLYSLATFKPEIRYVADLPLALKLHAAGAFLIVAVLPFTKLVHLLFSPVAFLRDPPVLYRWLSAGGTAPHP